MVMHEVLKNILMRTADCIYHKYFLISRGVCSEWVVFDLGQSQTPFFIYGIKNFEPKTNLATMGLGLFLPQVEID